MVRFLIRRTLLGVFVLWLITLLVFVIFFVSPSDVARTMAGRQATPQTVALIQHRLGLDEPLWRQYLTFVGRALRGDLGYDYYHQVPVTTIIASALPKTLSLVLGAAVLWLLIGVLTGVVSAVRPR
jgi:peptide/nickel transport system permease protein